MTGKGTGAPARPKAVSTASLPAGAWSTTVRVPFGRCDAAGIVYTPRYLDMFIEAIEVWYEKALGFTLRDLILERGIGLGYAETSANFFVPSRFGDRLVLTPIVEHVGRSSFSVIVHVVADGRARARGRLVSVATSLADGKVIPLPQDVDAGLRRYASACGDRP